MVLDHWDLLVCWEVLGGAEWVAGVRSSSASFTEESASISSSAALREGL